MSARTIVGVAGNVTQPSRTSVLVEAVVATARAQIGGTTELIELAAAAPSLFGAMTSEQLSDEGKEIIAAVDKSRNVMLGYAAFIADLYAPLAKKTSYEYLDEHMARFLQNQSDVDFLMQSPSVLVGTPAQLIERLEVLSARGIDEVLLRIDGMPHHQIVEAITLIGEEVIPHFARKK